MHSRWACWGLREARVASEWITQDGASPDMRQLCSKDALALHERSREGKSRLLDELCEVCGYDRKHATKAHVPVLTTTTTSWSPAALK
jgi:hypothetical protein